MSGECDKCGEHALDCVCNEDLTTISPIPESLVRHLYCSLYHSAVLKRVEGIAKWVCKEGCDE